MMFCLIFYRKQHPYLRKFTVNFFLQPTNLALLAIAVISGIMLLQPLLMQGNAKHVSATEATQMINQKAQILDVRTTEEFASGHIRQSKSLPVQSLAQLLPAAKLKQDKPVLIVCASGMRARRAAAVLTKEGFTDIAILDGGLKTWLDAQLPLVKG
jgi:rhodanese-related sulfurtransferase